MPDTFVLSILSRPRTIGDKDYMVAWDSQLNRAVITFVEDEELRDLNDQNGNEMTFGSELDAHRYLNGLWMEEHGEEDTWKTSL